MTSLVASKSFDYGGTKFVTNNYSAILTNNGMIVDFHIFQDFLRSGEIGFALTAPPTISGDQVLAIWRTGVFDDGGANGSPSLVFEFDNTTRIVTPQTVRYALQLPTHTSYTSLIGDTEMRRFFTEIGYDKDLKNLGQLKRNGLRKEWNFLFDCITKAFNNKSSNFDAFPIRHSR